jgi:hypothetical protein
MEVKRAVRGPGPDNNADMAVGFLDSASRLVRLGEFNGARAAIEHALAAVDRMSRTKGGR